MLGNKSNAGDGMRSTEEVIFKARSLSQMVQQEEAGRSAVVARANDRRWVPPLPDVWNFWEEEASGAWVLLSTIISVLRCWQVQGSWMW